MRWNVRSRVRLNEPALNLKQRGLLATFDDPGLDPLAPPQGGATPSLAPSSKVAKSRSVIAGAGFVTRACNHRPRRTLPETEQTGQGNEEFPSCWSGMDGRCEEVGLSGNEPV